LGDESVVVGVQSSTYITQQKKLASLVVAPWIDNQMQSNIITKLGLIL
jgi:hypothetical protein